MIPPLPRMIAAALALAGTVPALAQPPAPPAAPCVDRGDMTDMFAAMMPTILQRLEARCRPITGFYLTREPGMIGKYRAAAERSWPGAKRAITATTGKPAAEVAAVLDTPAGKQMMLDAVSARIGGNVDKVDCSSASEVLENIAPLPPRNLAAVLVTLMRQSDKRTPICPPVGG